MLKKAILCLSLLLPLHASHVESTRVVTSGFAYCGMNHVTVLKKDSYREVEATDVSELVCEVLEGIHLPQEYEGAHVKMVVVIEKDDTIQALVAEAVIEIN